MKYFKYVERDETWPGKYQLIDNPDRYSMMAIMKAIAEVEEFNLLTAEVIG